MKRILSLIIVSMVLLLVMVGCTSATSAKVDSNKKAILVVSFGTSYADTREATIDATEKRIADACPEYDIKRAFTSQIIIDKLKKRDNIEIDNPTEAFEKLRAEGYGEVIVQPLHVINGAEYDDLVEESLPYREIFTTLKIARPLLTTTEDLRVVAKTIGKYMPKLNEKEAVVLMGHGTHHDANATYSALDVIFKDEGMDNVFVGTVEAFPDLDTIEKKLADKNISKVTLLPLMLVAGDHAQNDMAGDESESWKMVLRSKGYQVDTVLKGLGEYKEIQDLYIEHLNNALVGETH